MKKMLLFLVFAFNIAGLTAQEVVSPSKEVLVSSEQVDVKPEFPGGMDGFNQYLGAYFNMPDSPDFKGGKVVSSFIVEKDGTLSDLKILEDPGFGAGAEIRRLLSICQRWTPAQLNGEKVRVSHIFPVEINIESNNTSEDYVKDLSLLEQQPSFPGGIKKFYEYIGRNFRIPEDAQGGKIIVRFIVNVDGTLTDIEVLRDPGFGTGKEAKRILRESPLWTPGIKDGKAVRAAFVLPITIQEPVRNYNAQYNRPKFYLNGRSKSGR